MKTVNNKLSVIAGFFLLFVAGTTTANGDVRNNNLPSDVIDESKLSIEGWMVDDNTWESSGTADFNELAQERNMVIENWMINEVSWGNAILDFSVPAEESLEVENWMVDETRWSNNVPMITEDSDSKIEIESWMLDTNFWGK